MELLCFTKVNIACYFMMNPKTKTSGVVLCDQAKIIDIHARDFSIIEKAPRYIVAEVVDIINGFIEIE